MRSKIALVEDDKILSQDVELVKIFKGYFISIPILNMSNNQSFSTQTCCFEENAISGIIHHPNINLIKSKYSCLANTFFFYAIRN